MLKDHVLAVDGRPDPQRLPSSVGRRAIAAWAGDRTPGAKIDTLHSREAINDWMDDALPKGIDPL